NKNNNSCINTSLCTSNNDCLSSNKKYCNELTGICVECTDHSHCGSGKICDNNVCFSSSGNKILGSSCTDTSTTVYTDCKYEASGSNYNCSC
ncbi:hypothetical protein EO238_25810, partial [Citrobacter sp. AAK_AS5]